MQRRFETSWEDAVRGKGAGMQGSDDLEKRRRLACCAIFLASWFISRALFENRDSSWTIKGAVQGRRPRGPIRTPQGMSVHQPRLGIGYEVGDQSLLCYHNNCEVPLLGPARSFMLLCHNTGEMSLAKVQ
jgi:hypothetical protein